MPISDHNPRKRPPTPAGAAPGARPPLTRREREILARLAEGLSGAQIAERLVLSPETVRTHVRNAMAKLGASTRSQAVALALERHEIGSGLGPPIPPPPEPRSDHTAAFRTLLTGLVSLYDVDGGAIYVLDDDGLALRRLATGGDDPELGLSESVALGEGALGRAALERRSQLLADPSGRSAHGALIAAPMLGAGRLLGVIALVARVSRPIGRNELLLLQALANRVGEIVVAGGDPGERLERTMERFRTSWSAAIRAF